MGVILSTILSRTILIKLQYDWKNAENLVRLFVQLINEGFCANTLQFYEWEFKLQALDMWNLWGYPIHYTLLLELKYKLTFLKNKIFSIGVFHTVMFHVMLHCLAQNSLDMDQQLKVTGKGENTKCVTISQYQSSTKLWNSPVPVSCNPSRTKEPHLYI